MRLALPAGLLRERSTTKLPSRQSFSHKLLLCEVHDVIAYGHSYIVKGAGTPRMTALLSTSAGTMAPIGARSLSMLVPGALVLCWISDDYIPIIISVVCGPAGLNTSSIPDSIVACGHAGLFADPAHQYFANREDCHGVFDFSAGRPVDNLPGDWGALNELGLGVVLGKLMTMMRASDTCKLEMFYIDQLARLFAYNWQHHTAGSEVEAYNDEGEWTSVEGYTPYPWEALGVANQLPAAALGYIFKLNTDADPIKGDKFGLEPQEELQIPFWRKRVFKGYLGDIERTVVMLPANDRHLYGTKTDTSYTGVFEQILGIDGSFTMRSAKSILFEKTVWIPVPDDLYPRDNPNGDTDFDNPSGINESLEEFPEGTEDENILRFDDMHAYFCQRLSSQGINLRKKDWFVKDDPPKTPGSLPKEVEALSPYTKYFADRPTMVEQDVDHRRKARYYKSRAYFGLTEEGGFVLEDAHGASIKVSGGNIEITCPGDVILRSGHSTQVWSGKDVVVKSNKDIDLSSANSDVRVKAERNMMLLGGNSGSGGMLLENRAQGSVDFSDPESINIGGLVLKCSRGTLGLLGDELHLKSMTRNLILDAKDGDNDIIMFGNELNKYLRSGSTEMIGSRDPIESTPARDISIMRHDNSGILATLNGPVKLGTPSLTLVNHRSSNGISSFRMKGNISIEGSGFATGDFSKTDTPTVSDYIVDRQEHLNEQNTERTAYLIPDVNQYLRNAGVLGNPAVYGNMGVQFRSTLNLHINGMKMYEAPWQKRFRYAIGALSTDDYPAGSFDEQEVYPRINPDTLKEEGIPTMPFPGYEAWNGDSDEAVFVRYDDVFYNSDATGGSPQPRGENVAETYDLGKIKTAEEGKFKDRYPVNG